MFHVKQSIGSLIIIRYFIKIMKVGREKLLTKSLIQVVIF